MTATIEQISKTCPWKLENRTIVGGWWWWWREWVGGRKEKRPKIKSDRIKDGYN